jgi:pimeloyl-ACP methyl ester carboxylesterase
VTKIYKTPEGQQLVEDRYRQFLKYWAAPNQQFHVPTSQGDTFIIACGDECAPPLLLLHGSAANSSSWMGDVGQWAKRFRIYAVDVIGEPGLSASTRPPLNSDAYVLWLDDVLNALNLQQASLVGVSLGGWMALDYATHRSERVQSIALISPGGVGRQKISILFKVSFFRLFGGWGTRKLRNVIFGRPPENPSPAARKFFEFIALIHQNFLPRTGKIPVFSDAALAKLTMPVLAIVGAKDVMLDSKETKRRLERTSKSSEVCYLDEAGHFIPGQGATISEFLERVLGPHVGRV